MADQRELEHWLEVEGFSKYSEAFKLSTQDSKNDPETEPYKSKYASREILLDLKEKLESFNTNNSGSETRLKSLKSVIEYELATNYIDTEEKGTGERYLNALQEKLDDFKLRPEFCSIMLKCYQQLGILWNGRGEFEKSFGYFSEAEKLYNEYKKTVETSPFDAQELFLTTTDVIPLEARDSIFENLHTHTLYYITQVYKNIGENKKSSMYCHKTLSRQLLTKLYDPVDWAVNCATLSQYHLTQEDYRSARHCLACASCVIAECPVIELKEPVDLDQESEDDRKIRERLPQAKANVALCWSKYCLDLLKNSAQKIEDDAKIEDIPSTTDDEEEMLRFESLDVSQLESDISCQIAKNYDEARLLFLTGQKHLKDAKEFYKLDGYVSNHVEIVQDHSQLFKYLIPFDSDMETQSKMYKRRVDMLVEVLTELSPQHYLLICRQLIFEIASVYGDMADLKIAIIQKNQPQQPSIHQIKKINTLLNNSAKYNTSFIDSMKQEGDLPAKYDESLLRVALLAHLYLARIHSKKICVIKEQRIENMKKSLELYKYVVHYCNGDEEGAKSFEIELQACREMVELLPLRLAKIAQEPDV